uniref:Uncharacterized protein n=1 Tax=Paramormyrops kingsleyae TaxID=1676925 RepID=A0A3B3T544_9TELE
MSYLFLIGFICFSVLFYVFGSVFSFVQHFVTALSPPYGFTVPPAVHWQPPYGFPVPPAVHWQPPYGFTVPPAVHWQPPYGFPVPPAVHWQPPYGFTVPPAVHWQPPYGFTPPYGFPVPPAVHWQPPYGFPGFPVPPAGFPVPPAEVTRMKKQENSRTKEKAKSIVSLRSHACRRHRPCTVHLNRPALSDTAEFFK